MLELVIAVIIYIGLLIMILRIMPHENSDDFEDQARCIAEWKERKKKNNA